MSQPTSPFNPDSSVVERVEPSPNIDERTGLGRPDMIVLHYTGMQFCHEAIHRLCDTKARVSSHYVVHRGPARSSSSCRRACAPGTPACRSGKANPTSTPARSASRSAIPATISAIPIFRPGRSRATITLCRSILTRNIIRPENIVAHSDVAPSRKNDPGEKFPWKRSPSPASASGSRSAPSPTARRSSPTTPAPRSPTCRRSLAEYGYGIDISGRYDDADQGSHHRLPAPFPAGAGRRHRRCRDACRRCASCSWRASAIAKPAATAEPPVEAKTEAAPKGLRPSPLTSARSDDARPIPSRQSAGRPLRQSPKGGRGGKSGLHGQTVPDNVRRGRPQGKCHREQTAAARCVLPR